MVNRTLTIITAIIIPLTTFFINSDTLPAQFFTDFSVELIPEQPKPTISISNTGQIQATNVIIEIHLNDTVYGFRDMCSEGNMYRMDSNILVAEFQRMSPLMVCTFPLIASEQIQDVLTVVTSDHRSPWFSFLPSYYPAWVTWFLVFVELVLLALIFQSSIRYFLHRIDHRFVSDKFQKMGFEDEICEYVLEEYGVKIGSRTSSCLNDLFVLCNRSEVTHKSSEFVPKKYGTAFV